MASPTPRPATAYTPAYETKPSLSRKDKFFAALRKAHPLDRHATYLGSIGHESPAARCRPVAQKTTPEIDVFPTPPPSAPSTPQLDSGSLKSSSPPTLSPSPSQRRPGVALSLSLSDELDSSGHPIVSTKSRHRSHYITIPNSSSPPTGPLPPRPPVTIDFPLPSLLAHDLPPSYRSHPHSPSSPNLQHNRIPSGSSKSRDKFHSRQIDSQRHRISASSTIRTTATQDSESSMLSPAGGGGGPYGSSPASVSVTTFPSPIDHDSGLNLRRFSASARNLLYRGEGGGGRNDNEVDEEVGRVVDLLDEMDLVDQFPRVPPTHPSPTVPFSFSHEEERLDQEMISLLHLAPAVVDGTSPPPQDLRLKPTLSNTSTSTSSQSGTTTNSSRPTSSSSIISSSKGSHTTSPSSRLVVPPSPPHHVQLRPDLFDSFFSSSLSSTTNDPFDEVDLLQQLLPPSLRGGLLAPNSTPTGVSPTTSSSTTTTGIGIKGVPLSPPPPSPSPANVSPSMSSSSSPNNNGNSPFSKTCQFFEMNHSIPIPPPPPTPSRIATIKINHEALSSSSASLKSTRSGDKVKREVTKQEKKNKEEEGQDSPPGGYCWHPTENVVM